MGTSVDRLLALLRGRSRDHGLLGALLFWNPTIALAFDVTFGGTADLWRRWLSSLVVADTVTAICFGAVLGARRLEVRLHARRGTPAPERGPGFYFGASALLMPLALPVGLALGSRFGALLGRPFHALDLHAYRYGLAFGAIATLLFFFQRGRLDAREAAAAAQARIRDLENETLRAQVAALTAEMNPHMLFNTLNTIAALIHDDPEQAEATVIELAELYRGILRAAGGATHPLSTELRLCEAYLRIEHARFRDRLTVDVSVDPSVDASAIEVPVLLLQPLVENAVKHGIAPRAGRGRVTLGISATERGVVAVVEDDGVGLGGSAAPGEGRALSNCRARLRLAYGPEGGLTLRGREGGGTRAELTLPQAAVLP